MNRRAQTWSMEAYIAVSVFLLAMIFFYALVGLKSADHSVQEASEQAASALSGTEQFEDNELDESEITTLIGMDCDDIKELVGVKDPDKKVCMFLTDSDGNFIDFDPDTGKTTIGCGELNDGFEISTGVWCGAS